MLQSFDFNFKLYFNSNFRVEIFSSMVGIFLYGYVCVRTRDDSLSVSTVDLHRRMVRTLR